MSKLEPYHYSIINDNSIQSFTAYNYYKAIEKKKKDFFQERYDKIKDKIGKFNIFSNFIFQYFSTISSMIKKGIKKLPVFEPDHKFRFSFDIFMLFYTLFIVSQKFLNFGFDLNQSNFESLTWNLLQTLPPYIYLLDLLLSLNTAYYSKGQYIKNHFKILINYCKHDFIFDILISVTLFINSNPFTDLIVILKLINIGQLINRLDEYLQFRGRKEGLFHLIKLIVNLLFLAHICACLWHYMAIYEEQNGFNEDSWLKVKGLSDKSWKVRYIYSLYFSIVTMMTVGYGDFSAQNYLEAFFNILIIIYGCGVFGYTINKIGEIFKEMNLEEREFKKKSKIIADFMRKRGLNENLQTKIKRYLEYMHEEDKHNFKDNYEFANSLSQTLKEEYFHEIYGKMLKDHPFFCKFSPDFINKLTTIFKEHTFAPDDYICNTSSDNDLLIYFILKGEITNTLNGQSFSSLNLGKLKAGDVIGEQYFITGDTKKSYAKCNIVTHVAYLKRSEFLELFALYKEDYEKFCHYKTNAMLNGDSSLFSKLKCASCQNPDHDILHCPLINYIPNYDYIIKKHNFSEPQIRQTNLSLSPHSRKCHFNARAKINIIQESAQRINEEDEEDRIAMTMLGSNNSIPDIISPSLNNNQEKTLSRIISNEKIENNLSSEDFDNKKKKTVIFQQNKEPKNKFRNLQIKTRIDGYPDTPTKSKNILNSPLISSYIHEPLSSSSLKIVNKEFEKPEINHKYLDIDQLKNFKFFFPNGNFERILMFLRPKKSIKKQNKSPVSRFSRVMKKNNNLI